MSGARTDSTFSAPVEDAAAAWAARRAAGKLSPDDASKLQTWLSADPQHARGIPATPELFFCRDMEGYAWSVRKGDYLNVGIGRRDSKGFARHIEQFVAFLESRRTLVPGTRPRWHGHAYMARGAGARPILGDGILVVGDAAGLAFPESGEGIKPAIESGRLDAETLVASGGRIGLNALQPYADEILRRHPSTTARLAPARGAVAMLGRILLRSPTFTRHVVLDRWFLRTVAGS